MKEDPTFKERFGISTPIHYVYTVVVEPKYQKKYDRAWRKFQREMEVCDSPSRRKRFDAVLKRIDKLQDDLPYCHRVAIRYINKKVGYGVFAKEDIPRYSILNQYGGILRPDELIPATHDSTFMFSDFEKFSIDAHNAGNWCRFMNHNAEGDPKTNVLAWEHYSDFGPRIFFTACRHGIKKGAQLLYTYGDSYWEDESSFIKL